jgi:hypothetical protein
MTRMTIQPVNLNTGPGEWPTVVLSGTTSPAVPASGTAAVNSNPWSVAVTVTGGTLTEVAVNGVSAGTGDGTYFVPAGGSITLTYSVAPTWAWAPAGVDAAGAGGTNFAAAWDAPATGVQFYNNGEVFLWYYNGGVACTASLLIGEKVEGDVFPYTQDQVVLGTGTSGWIQPLSPQKYNQTDASQFSSSPGGVIGSSGVGLACVDFSDVSSLSVRLMQLVPQRP